MNERQIGIEKMRNADHGDKSRADALTIPRDLLNDLIDDVQSFADQVPCREREKAFRADLLARARAIAASPVEQPAQLTAQDALAAIETFEIVGDNNDSREPNNEDRFILTEFVAHLFGGFRVEQPAAAPRYEVSGGGEWFAATEAQYNAWSGKKRIATIAAASPAAGAVKAWINYPVITNGGEFAGYGEPELSFKRLAYGYDTDRAVPLIAAPQPAQADAAAGATSVPYDGLTEEFTDEIARLANDAPGIREAVAGALESCGVIIAPAQADALHVSGHHPEYVKGFNDGKREFSNAFELGIHEGKRQADAPAEAREPVAWVTDDDRAITAAQKQRALADGGATASSVRPYSIPCYAVSAPADAGEAVAHMRVRSTDAGSTSHAIDIAPEAAALDLKPGEYLLYLAPPTTRAAHLTTTLSPDQRISMAAKLFFFANELLNGADQS